MLTITKNILASAVTVLALAAQPLLQSTPVHAAPCDPGVGGHSCGAEGEAPGDNGGGGGTDDGNEGGNGNGEDVDQPGNGDGGFDGGGEDPAPPVAETGPVAAQAKDNVEYPVPELMTSPPGKSFVRIKTFFWIPQGIDDPPPVATAEIGPAQGVQYQKVTAYAKVAYVEWHLFEDGDTLLSCEGKGQVNGEGPGDPCDYVFKYASVHEGVEAHHITAIVYWNIHWECEGACTQEEGDYEGVPAFPAGELDLPVDEIQTEAN